MDSLSSDIYLYAIGSYLEFSELLRLSRIDSGFQLILDSQLEQRTKEALVEARQFPELYLHMYRLKLIDQDFLEQVSRDAANRHDIEALVVLLGSDLNPARDQILTELPIRILSQMAQRDPQFNYALERAIMNRAGDVDWIIPTYPQLILDLYRLNLIGLQDIYTYAWSAIQQRSVGVLSFLIKAELIDLNQLNQLANDLYLSGVDPHSAISLVDLLNFDYNLYQGLIRGSAFPFYNDENTVSELINAAEQLDAHHHPVPREILEQAVQRLSWSVLFSSRSAFDFIDNGSNPLIQLLSDPIRFDRDQSDLAAICRETINNSFIYSTQWDRLRRLLINHPL